MKLQRLTLKNFMPFKGEAVLDFPQDSTLNSLLVMGDNMRGKTSLLNGIRWAFYGKAQGRHLRPILLHLMPNSEATAAGDWTMEARIEFEAGGAQYDFRRVAAKKPMVAHPEKPEDYQVIAYLKKDGVAIAGNEIEAEINKFAPEQVSRFFLFDGELLQEYEELLVEGSEQGKQIKEAIEQALGVPALTNGRQDLQTLWKKAQKEQGREASMVKGLEVVAESFEKWRAKRDQLESDLNELRRQQAQIKEERLALEDQIANSQSIYVQKVELDSNVSRRASLDRQIQEKVDHKLALMSEAWRDLLRPRIAAKKAELQGLQSGALAKSKARSKLQYQIEHLREHLTDAVCPTCGQVVEIKDRTVQQQQLDRYLGQLADLGGDDIDIESIANMIKSIDPILSNSVKDRLVDTSRDLEKFEVELVKCETRIDELEAELDGQGADDAVRMRQQLNQISRDEQRQQVNADECARNLAKANAEILSASQRMEAQSGKSTTKAAQIAKAFEQMHAAFSASIDSLRTTLRTTVETNASKAFIAMSTQKSYKGLSINANYGLTIIGEDGNSVPLRSAGAEQIVALSLIDGLSRAGRGAGPVVMDTPFGRLDTKHRKNILAYLPESASQLVLFVHDGEIGGGAALEALAHRIGARYEIQEVSQSHSILVRTS